MKDAYYFSHDSNMWNDPKIIKVRRKHGIVGYGVVNRLNELLRAEDYYRLGLDEDSLDDLIFDFNSPLVDRDVLEDIILHFKLYEREGGDGSEFGYFYSKRMRRNMEKMEEIKQKRSYAGQMSGKARQALNTSSTNVEQNPTRKGNKKKESKGYNILKRSEEFEISLQKYIKQYNSDLLKNFYDYWTEPNKSRTMLKYEMEKTWDLGRRLKRWADNDFGNKNKLNGMSKFKKDANGKFWIGYCSKCNISDFYDDYGIKQDSRCCKSKLLPEKQIAVR
tara:strand:- start:795 stop:1625 length:831 start_codon:yes stop_codon:yes gene_type:complete